MLCLLSQYFISVFFVLWVETIFVGCCSRYLFIWQLQLIYYTARLQMFKNKYFLPDHTINRKIITNLNKLAIQSQRMRQLEHEIQVLKLPTIPSTTAPLLSTIDQMNKQSDIQSQTKTNDDSDNHTAGKPSRENSFDSHSRRGEDGQIVEEGRGKESEGKRGEDEGTEFDYEVGVGVEIESGVWDVFGEFERQKIDNVKMQQEMRNREDDNESRMVQLLIQTKIVIQNIIKNEQAFIRYVLSKKMNIMLKLQIVRKLLDEHIQLYVVHRPQIQHICSTILQQLFLDLLHDWTSHSTHCYRNACHGQCNQGSSSVNRQWSYRGQGYRNKCQNRG